MNCLSNCSLHGTCSYFYDPLHLSYNNTCTCDVGFVGFEGHACSIDWGAHQCKGNCSAHETCVNKTCVCDPEWIGIDWNQKFSSSFPLCLSTTQITDLASTGHVRVTEVGKESTALNGLHVHRPAMATERA